MHQELIFHYWALSPSLCFSIFHAVTGRVNVCANILNMSNAASVAIYETVVYIFGVHGIILHGCGFNSVITIQN